MKTAQAIKFPVEFDVTPPARFERMQLLIRLVISMLFGVLGGLLGGFSSFLYLLLPAAAAILIAQKGSERFLSESGPVGVRLLRWLMAFYAYMTLLTDRFPMEKPEQHVRFDVAISGHPTVGSALLRIFMSIPSVILLAILGFFSGIAWVVSVVFILIRESYPEELYRFQRGVVRWAARLLAYHASLVEEYPPFTMEPEF